MGDGHSGSDPLMTPMGRELIMLQISNRTVCSCAKVRTFPEILCVMDRLVNFTIDSLRPFWCWPSAGARVHLMFLVAAHSCIVVQSHLLTSSAISFDAAMS